MVVLLSGDGDHGCCFDGKVIFPHCFQSVDTYRFQKNLLVFQSNSSMRNAKDLRMQTPFMSRACQSAHGGDLLADMLLVYEPLSPPGEPR